MKAKRGDFAPLKMRLCLDNLIMRFNRGATASVGSSRCRAAGAPSALVYNEKPGAGKSLGLGAVAGSRAIWVRPLGARAVSSVQGSAEMLLGWVPPGES